MCATSRSIVHPGQVGTATERPAPETTEAISAISASARAQNHS